MCGLSRQMFHVPLGIYIVLLLGGMFHIRLSGPIGLQCCSSTNSTSLLIFYLVVLAIIDEVSFQGLFFWSTLSKFPLYIRSSEVQQTNIYNPCALLVNYDHYMLSIFVSLTFFYLKSILLDESLATPVLWLPLTWLLLSAPFHLQLTHVQRTQVSTYRQNRVGFFFFFQTHSANLSFDWGV